MSIVCSEDNVPEGIKYEDSWRILKIEGSFDFSLIGILALISNTSTKEDISIFAVSTYDTDYILLKDVNLNKAVETLQKKGYEILM